MKVRIDQYYNEIFMSGCDGASLIDIRFDGVFIGDILPQCHVSMGKNRILIDPNGEKLQGYEMFNAVKSLDINDEDDKRIYEFLKDHP